MEVVYICNRKSHCKHACYSECKHTKNKEWALNEPEDRVYEVVCSDNDTVLWEIDEEEKTKKLTV